MLVPLSESRAADRCTHCGARHTIEPDTRWVRWLAKPA
jgi:hypothetical protein